MPPTQLSDLFVAAAIGIIQRQYPNFESTNPTCKDNTRIEELAMQGQIAAVNLLLTEQPGLVLNAIRGYARDGNVAQVEALICDDELEKFDTAAFGYAQGGHSTQVQIVIHRAMSIYPCDSYGSISTLDAAVSGYKLGGYCDNKPTILTILENIESPNIYARLFCDMAVVDLYSQYGMRQLIRQSDVLYHQLHYYFTNLDKQYAQVAQSSLAWLRDFLDVTRVEAPAINEFLSKTLSLAAWGSNELNNIASQITFEHLVHWGKRKWAGLSALSHQPITVNAPVVCQYNHYKERAYSSCYNPAAFAQGVLRQRKSIDVKPENPEVSAFIEPVKKKY